MVEAAYGCDRLECWGSKTEMSIGGSAGKRQA